MSSWDSGSMFPFGYTHPASAYFVYFHQTPPQLKRYNIPVVEVPAPDQTLSIQKLLQGTTWQQVVGPAVAPLSAVIDITAHLTGRLQPPYHSRHVPQKVTAISFIHSGTRIMKRHRSITLISVSNWPNAWRNAPYHANCKPSRLGRYNSWGSIHLMDVYPSCHIYRAALSLNNVVVGSNVFVCLADIV